MQKPAQIKNFQMSASNGRDAKDNWPAMYQLIAKANDVLRNVPNMDISANLKSVAVGKLTSIEALLTYG